MEKITIYFANFKMGKSGKFETKEKNFEKAIQQFKQVYSNDYIIMRIEQEKNNEIIKSEQFYY